MTRRMIRLRISQVAAGAAIALAPALALATPQITDEPQNVDNTPNSVETLNNQQSDTPPDRTRDEQSSTAEQPRNDTAANDTVTFRGKTGDDRVVPDNPPSDEALADQVRQALRDDQYLGNTGIEVEVIHGVAILSQDVDTAFQRSRAETVANRVPDVVGVISTIDVKALENGARQSDGELLADIRNEIYWNPEINLDDIQVSVDNGHVRLDGTVDSYRTRGAVMDEARSAGATDIENNITVQRDEAYGAASQGQ